MTQSTEVAGDSTEAESRGLHPMPTDSSDGQEDLGDDLPADNLFNDEEESEDPLKNVPEPTEDDLSDIDEDIEPVDKILHDIPFGDRHEEASVKIYLDELLRTPLLDAEEEVALAMRIEEGKKATIDMTKPKEELDEKRIREIPRLIEDGRTAHKHLFTANLPLVVSVAKKFVGRGVSFLDLIQEGNLGLMKGVDKFDYHKGFRFSTYARWWIRQGITRATLNQNRNVRIVEEMGNAINKMNRVNKELTNRLRRQPSIEELANELQTTPKNVMDMQKAAQLEYSFNMPVDDGGAHEFGESIEDENQKPEADATRNLFSEDMANILHGLLPLELLVLQLRFGLLDGISRNIAEVGRELHIRQERVKSVEFKALYRLAHGRYRDLLLQYYGNEHPTKDIDDEPEE